MAKFLCTAYPKLLIPHKTKNIQFTDGEYETDDDEIINIIDKASKSVLIVKVKETPIKRGDKNGNSK